jgi:hypothetical protein
VSALYCVIGQVVVTLAVATAIPAGVAWLFWGRP